MNWDVLTELETNRPALLQSIGLGTHGDSMMADLTLMGARLAELERILM